MSFVPNPLNEQLSLFDSFEGLTDREKKFLDRSWTKYFSEYIFPKIEEQPYAVLYSQKDSRPNTPVNIKAGGSAPKMPPEHEKRDVQIDTGAIMLPLMSFKS